MRSGWRVMPFSEAVVINPRIRLERGATYPFVSMAAVDANSQWAYAERRREYSGGGSRFQHEDTLMARITPCLENGKIARYRSADNTESAHGSTEFIVMRAIPPVTSEYTYLLARDEEFRAHAIQSMTGTSGR